MFYIDHLDRNGLCFDATGNNPLGIGGGNHPLGWKRVNMTITNSPASAQEYHPLTMSRKKAKLVILPLGHLRQSSTKSLKLNIDMNMRA